MRLLPFHVVPAAGREEFDADAVIVAVMGGATALTHVPHVRAVRAVVSQLPQVHVGRLREIKSSNFVSSFGDGGTEERAGGRVPAP